MKLTLEQLTKNIISSIDEDEHTRDLEIIVEEKIVSCNESTRESPTIVQIVSNTSKS